MGVEELLLWWPSCHPVAEGAPPSDKSGLSEAAPTTPWPEALVSPQDPTACARHMVGPASAPVTSSERQPVFLTLGCRTFTPLLPPLIVQSPASRGDLETVAQIHTHHNHPHPFSPPHTCTQSHTPENTYQGTQLRGPWQLLGPGQGRRAEGGGPEGGSGSK